jgi:hypothetical protein
LSTNECRAPGTPIFSLFRVTCSKTPPGLFPSWIYLKSLKFHEGISQKQNQKQNSHYVPHKHRRPPKNSSKVQCEVASLRTKPKTLIESPFQEDTNCLVIKIEDEALPPSHCFTICLFVCLVWFLSLQEPH